MLPNSKTVVVLSTSILLLFSAPGFSGEKGGPARRAAMPMVVTKAGQNALPKPTAPPTRGSAGRVAGPSAANGDRMKKIGRRSRPMPVSPAGMRGLTFEEGRNRRPGGIELPGGGNELMPERARRIKDRMAMEGARFRHQELGMKTPLPEGLDHRRIPGRGCPNRSGEDGLDTSYPPGDRDRENYIAGVKQEWRTSGVIPPEGMDERTAGLIEYEDGESAWVDGDTRMGPDDENVTWGTLEPADSDDGDEKGTKENASAGDEDIMDEDAADIDKDPEPEGDDPDEVLSPAGRYRDVMTNVDEALPMQAAVQGDGRGSGGGGCNPWSDPAEQRRRKKLNDMWGATHVVPYAVAPVDPEDGGPDESGSPVGEGMAALTNGYAHQPEPGGDDPDDPRAGDDRTVGGQTHVSRMQNATLNSHATGAAFSPAIGDDGNPTGPDGPEF